MPDARRSTISRSKRVVTTAPTPLRMPVRTTRVELNGPYKGFWLTMRSNPPLSLFTSLQVGVNFDTLRDKIHSLIMDWNFVDDEGKPIPAGSLDDISIELIGLTIQAYLDQIKSISAVPKA